MITLAQACRPVGAAKLRRGGRHMRLSAAVERYLHEVVELEHALSTQKAYKSHLKRLVSVATLEATDSVAAFTPALVTAYFRRLKDKGLAAETLLQHRSALSEFGAWVLRQRLVTENPMRDAPKIRRPKRLPRPFDHAELGRLLALEIAAEDRALRGLLYYAGLRVSEASTLRWRHVRLASSEHAGALRIIGKGDKERIVPLLDELDAILRAYVVAPHRERQRLLGGFVLEMKGGPWPVRSIEHHVARWGARAGVADATPHRFRHSCATMLLDKGMRPEQVQVFLGHASLSTTMGYAKLSDAKMEDALRRVNASLAADKMYSPNVFTSPPVDPAPPAGTRMDTGDARVGG